MMVATDFGHDKGRSGIERSRAARGRHAGIGQLAVAKQ